MYIVIKKFHSSSIDETIENAKNEFLPMISKLPGFVSYNIIKAAEDMVVSILSFASEAEGKASTVTAFAWVKENGFDALYQVQEVIEGEVVVEG